MPTEENPYKVSAKLIPQNHARPTSGEGIGGRSWIRFAIGMATMATSLLIFATLLVLACLQLFVLDQAAYEGVIIRLVRNHLYVLALPGFLGVAVVLVTIADIVYQRRNVTKWIVFVLLLNVAGAAYYWIRELRSTR